MDYLWKRNTLAYSDSEVFSDTIFYLFGSEELFTKRDHWSLLLCCLFKLSKYEKTPSSSFVRLVKTWWHWIQSKWRYPSFSFLGLVKCTRMDSSEGRIYMTSIWYPLQACVKIKRYSPEMVGENGSFSSVVLAVCHSWTWHLSAFVSGWGHLISFLHFASVGLDNPFWPLICSLPRHHDL